MKCLYVRTECMFEKKGKCGRMQTCPSARILMEKDKKEKEGKKEANGRAELVAS